MEQLTEKDLLLFKELLYAAKWSGKDWETVISPIAKKLERMLEKKEESKEDAG